MYKFVKSLQKTSLFKQTQRMDKQTPESFFRQTIKDLQQLSKANKTLSQMLANDIAIVKKNNSVEETFIHRCIQYLGEDSTNQSNRFQVITLLQPAIVQKFPNFPAQIQDTIRSGLLNVAVARYKNIKAMGALGLLTRQIIELDNKVKDGFNQWIEPMNEMIKWMSSEESGQVAEAGVQFFIYLFKQTPFTSSNSDLPVHKLANPLLQTLFQLFTAAPQQQTINKISIRQKILFLVLQVIKSFSYLDGTDDAVVKECLGDSIELWASLFASILKSSVVSHFGIKKYTIKILVVIYRDMSNMCQSRLKSLNAQAELLAAWQFAYKFIPCYLAAQVWKLKQLNGEKLTNTSTLPYFEEDYDISLDPVQAIAHNILEMLSVFSSSGLLSFVVKLSIYHLTNALFHYYIITAHELRTWSCNHLYLVSPPQHESMRGKILNILNDIIQKNGDYAIQAVLLIAQKFLMNHSQSQTVETVSKIIESMNLKEIIESGRLEISIKVEDIIKFTNLSGCDVKQVLNVRGETWRKSQVALSILGRFSEDIIVFQSRQQGAFDIENFVKGLMKQFEIEELDVSVCLLKGQSLYCLTRFTQIISIRYKQLFTDLVTSCSVCVSEVYPTAIRVSACKSLTIFFRKIDKHKLKLSEQQKQKMHKNKVAEGIMTIQITSQTNSYALQALIELVKCLGPECLEQDMAPLYLLDNIHKNIAHQNTLKVCFNFLEILCQTPSSYEKAVMAKGQHDSPIIPHFIQDCLETYLNIVKSDQKHYLKSLDIDLITTVLKLSNIVLEKCPTQSTQAQNMLVLITPLLTQIVMHNQNLPIQVASTICLKNLIRLCPNLIKQKKYEKKIVDAIHALLKIPADKTFEGASIYVGNLILLAFEFLLQKPDQQILQQVVLKVFKSRTPSVIQSLVLVYSRMINGKTDPANPFAKGEWETKLKNITDFLASFSIENRMGLKILVDKWLLQQSLFRGTYTKISTFMALSKMFLLRDKRIDNLLVIGFNPSHTNINSDVNAPLKILATLIRCLNNQMGGKDEENEGEEEAPNFQMKEEPEKGTSIDVGLQKFKQTIEEAVAKNQNVGGLADRENQQGSTCYMSAMLQFYDDGQQCDETTQDDLVFLKDSSIKFTLSQYLTDFFLHLNNPDSPNHQYFIQCLKQLLKEDLKTLQKYVKVAV